MLVARERCDKQGAMYKNEKHGDCKRWQKDVDRWRKANGLKPIYEKEGEIK